MHGGLWNIFLNQVLSLVTYFQFYLANSLPRPLLFTRILGIDVLRHWNWKLVTVCRHRLELMRHIYNGGSSDTSGSFDKDEAWSEVMEAGTEAGGVAEGVAEKGQRWVKTDPLTMLPDTMCVDLSLTSLLACILPAVLCPRHHPHAFLKCWHTFYPILKHFLLPPFATFCFCRL